VAIGREDPARAADVGDSIPTIPVREVGVLVLAIRTPRMGIGRHGSTGCEDRMMSEDLRGEIGEIQMIRDLRIDQAGGWTRTLIDGNDLTAN
jgi:hypothetical protein